MHLSPWTHVSDCTSMIFNRKSRHRDAVFSDDSHEEQAPSNHGPLRTSNLRDALKEDTYEHRFHSIESAHSIPELRECFNEFIAMYPAYQSSNQLDQLRSDEYFHLAEPEAKVCLDYCGFGLFSFLQTTQLPESSAFSLSKITANLRSHALYGGAQKNTAEDDIKATIMDYLNTSENEYSFVFTVSRGSAFQLLADSYPFQNNKKLLIMFDHESQSVALMAQRAREKGAEVYNAKFKWPFLKVCRAELIKILSRKKRSGTDSAAGLFIFPVQSRVSGEKYDYRWMALAKQHNWHVLLDAGSLGPKDMESFGLSLFRPDFIITSFYRVFGSDPTGFGCLLIKNSVLDCLQNQSGGAGSGMVRIVHDSPSYLSDSVDGEDGFNWAEEDGITSNKEAMVPDGFPGSKIPAFSGAYTAAQVKHVIENEIDTHRNSPAFQASYMSGQTDSTGEIMKSPIFSEDASFESSYLISLGQSPFGSENSGQLNRGKMGTTSPTTSFSERKNGKPLPPKSSIDLNSAKTDPKMEHHTSVIQREVDGPDSNGGLIRRETEFEFMVLGRREGNTNGLDINIDQSVSFSFDVARPSKQLSHYLDSWEAASRNPVDGRQDEDDYEDDQELIRADPEIVCRHIDHINMIGSDKISLRLRYLVNWLITSLLQLRLPGSESEDGGLLVRIYGPKVKYERGAAVAFNVRGKAGGLIHPETVQKLAEKNGINLGVGFLRNIRFVGKEKTVEMNDCSICELSSRHGNACWEAVIRMEVVTASLGFLTNFEDVYKMWAFVARFLDPLFAGDDGLSDIVER